MNRQYEAFCVADPHFYDAVAGATGTFAFQRPVPEGWRYEPLDDWLMYAPADAALPAQGWKIHVSACLSNAERILDRVWDYCVPRRLPFKYIHGPQALLMRNAKYAPRRGSGKFVTVYPAGDAELESVCGELAGLLDGEPGPYVLSDLRLGAGPVYVRYGAFAPRYCLSGGRLVAAIADRDGVLVPDPRGPVFALPDWIALPEFLAPHLRARNATTVADLPYRIEQVLHFSNGGGLYLAVDTRTGQQVVLKEARPHAGLDGAGNDAVTRLRRERAALERLADVLQVPRVHDSFELGEHCFLAVEYVDGQPLNKLQVERYPLIGASANETARREYTTWALAVYREVEWAVEAMHERGVVHGDLHMLNVLVRPDDSVAILDFEVAGSVDADIRRGLGNQAFAAPAGRTGRDIDRYSLACLRLALFLPLTAMLRLAPEKAARFADVIAEQFPVPRLFLDEAVEVIAGRRPAAASASAPAAASAAAASASASASAASASASASAAAAASASAPARPAVPTVPAEFDAADWPALRAALAGAIDASASRDRDDRLFPGDIEQFGTGGGINLAHGAAGVLYALWTTGAGHRREDEDWLITRALHPVSGTSVGLYDGLHGVAYALDRLGRRAEALDVLEICLREKWEALGPDLMGGLSGIGLNLLHFAGVTGDPALRAAAERAAGLLADRLGAVDSVPETSGGDHPYAGLMRGSSGPALLFLRLYEETADPGMLDLAGTALRQDLRRCTRRADGQLQVNEGWRTMPYLGQGSVGIGIVLDRYLRHRGDEDLARAGEAVYRAATAPFYVQSGLFAGRAGIIAYLAHRARTDHVARAELTTQIRHLAWHALPYRGNLAFPGEQLLRLSMDLATGTAGVLLSLGMALADSVSLPFLPTHSLPTYRGWGIDPSLNRKEVSNHGASGSPGHAAVGR